MVRLLDTLISGLSTGSSYALLGIALNLIIMSADVLNIAVTEFAVLGAFVVIGTVGHGLSLPVAVVVTMLGAAVVGALQYDVSMRSPSRGGSSVRTPFVITLAVALIMRGVEQAVWGTDVYGLRSFTRAKPFLIDGVAVPTQSIWVVGATIVASVTVWFVFGWTVWGKVLRAIAQNKEAARLVGIKTERVTRFTFMVAGALATMAGVFIVPITFVSYDTGIGFLLYAFIAVGIGGFGKSSGAILGGLSVGILNAVVSGYVSALFGTAIVFAILIVVLAVFPGGVLGRAQDAIRRV